MKKTDQIFEAILKTLELPSKEKQAMKKATKELIIKLEKALKTTKVIVGGSLAKETWISKKLDIDLFVLFNKTQNKNISKLLESAIKKTKLKYQKIHGSRDYYQINYKNLNFEIIPIIKINKAENALNITDITPLHTKWVNKNSKTLKKEIILMKLFCKATKIYGAESHISGLSGYACEILVIKNKSFLKTLKEISKWNTTKKIIIDPEKHHRINPLMTLNKSKTTNQLIIIDPVDKSRNVTAAISLKSLKKLIETSKNFIKNPSIEYFINNKLTIEQIKKQNKNKEIVIIQITPKKTKKDIAGSAAIKTIEHFKQALEKQYFEIIETNYDPESYIGWITTKKIKDIYEHKGPKVATKKHAAIFKKKYKNHYAKKGILYSKIKIKEKNPKKILKKIENDSYVKSKVIRVQII